MMNDQKFTVIVLLSIFVARTHTKGEDQRIFVGPQVIQQSQAESIVMSGELESRLTDFKAQTFMEGSDVILKCNNPKIQWNELIYIVWNISLQSKKCWIGMESSVLNSTCNDGKKLLTSSDGIYLFIPKISKEDKGSYLCDVSFKGGGYGQKVNLSVNHFTSWLEVNNGQKVAVCQAKYEQSDSKPTLQWEPALNFLSNTNLTNTSNTAFIVENRVYLPDNFTINNLTCVATYPTRAAQQNLTNNEIITITVGSICFILVSVAVVYILQRMFNNSSALKKANCNAQAEEEAPQGELYANIVQRTTSIYDFLKISSREDPERQNIHTVYVM